MEISFTFSHGTGFKAPRDFAKKPRLELTGKHEKFAMFVFLELVPTLPLIALCAKMFLKQVRFAYKAESMRHMRLDQISHGTDDSSFCHNYNLAR